MTEPVLMNDQEIRDSISNMAYSIVRKSPDLSHTFLIGIKTRGVYVAGRLSDKIKEISGVRLKVGELDTRPFRDDIDYEGGNESVMPFNVDGADIIIVDDVLYTGRTMRAAMDAIIEYGRPSSIKISVLIDRGHREYPISADFVGRMIPTSSRETVRMKLREIDGGRDRVIVI
ncbi:MAG: bifunctional pyr operon transcriptional regulator/uracil phosphoribosyltransferase PyrR [Candidatus Altiarchaeota archaeon]